MDNFYVLSDILVEKCSCWVSCPFHAKSNAIEQVTLGDQPDNAIDLFATLVYFSATFPFG